MLIEPREFQDWINLPAEIESFEALWVKSEASGRVVSVSAKEGQHIEKGDVLVKLDDRDYQLRLDSIEASYELAVIDQSVFQNWSEKR